MNAPETTFTLAEIAEAFGFSYGCTKADRSDPIFLALNALDDARRTLNLTSECLVGDEDRADLMNVVANAWKRTDVAIAVLQKVRGRAGIIAEIDITGGDDNG